MKTVRSSSRTQLLLGYLAVFGSIIANMISATCVQALQGAIPDFQLSAIRAIVQGLTYITAGLIVSTDFIVKNKYIAKLIYAGATYFCYNVGFFAGATYLPLGDLQGVVVIAGIAFAVAQAKLLFKSDIEKSVIIAAFVCVVGVVLTVQPSWLFKEMTPTADTAITSFMNASSTLNQLKSSSDYGYTVSSHEVLLGYAFGVLVGAGLGTTSDANGILLHDVKLIPKVTYAMLACTVGSVAFMFYFEDPVYKINIERFMLVIGHSLLSAVVSFAAVYAASILSGTTLCIMWSFEVVTMLASQYTIMHSIKPGNYNWIEVIGCIIIVFGASVPAVIDILAHKAKANELP